MTRRKGFNVGEYGEAMLSAQDLARRVGEGSLSLDRVKIGIQMLSEGGDPDVIKVNPSLPTADGLKRLVLEPDRPLDSWREVLKIEKRDWSDDIQTYFGEPEPWEVGLSEVWYDVEAPDQAIWSLEASNRLSGRGLHGFTQRMGFALAKAEPKLVRKASMALIGSARPGSVHNLLLPYFSLDGGRLCARVAWNGNGSWGYGLVFPGFRKV